MTDNSSQGDTDFITNAITSLLYAESSDNDCVTSEMCVALIDKAGTDKELLLALRNIFIDRQILWASNGEEQLSCIYKECSLKINSSLGISAGANIITFPGANL